MDYRKLLDEHFADALDVSVEVYIKKIEKTTEKRRKVIIMALSSGKEEKVEQAKRIFELI